MSIDVSFSASKAAMRGVHSGLAPQPGSSLVDQALGRWRTFLLRPLPETTTTHDLISELRQLGCGDFDFLHMPVANSNKLFRGFVIINYSTVEGAMRFIAAANGHRFAGTSVRASIEVAVPQGIMPNLDAMQWGRRRRKITHVCDKRGQRANGNPLVLLRGQLQQMLNGLDVEAARAVYGY